MCIVFLSIYHNKIIQLTKYIKNDDTLDWFRSYLSGRIQRVAIEDAVSVDQEFGFAVP